ncbi:hypothetical protein CQ11_09035 [Trueperella pyogenes]|nr:hypothetical protein CQ11_09035 [Trueperella pyogenes]
MRLRIDKNRCHPGGGIGAQHVFRIDAIASEILDRVVREDVVADASQHEHIGSQARRRDSLVSALASTTYAEIGRLHSFAFLRHAIDVGDQVDHV